MRRRRNVPHYDIVRYWRDEGLERYPENPCAFEGFRVPRCFGCGRVFPYRLADTPEDRWRRASRFLDRAHLVAHVHNGLDAAHNLVLLCRPCHLQMPDYDLTGNLALWWLRRKPPYDFDAERLYPTMRSSSE